MKKLITHILPLAACILQTSFAAETRPNILLVMVDDMGYGDTGFNEGKDIRTPELDKLAKEGTIFTSAYVAHPFCGPSRVALLTGRYPHMIGEPFNLPNSGDGIEDYNKLGVDVNEQLMSTTLKSAGYRTGIIGKWHLGITEPYHPNNRGFDEFYGFLGGGHEFYPEQYKAKYERQVQAGNKNINEYLLPLEHNGKPTTESEYLTDALTSEAVTFVEDSAKTKEPFFLYLAYNAPHAPIQPKAEDLELLSDIKDPKRRAYAAMVYSVDRGVGRLVKTLKDTGNFENTLIVFLSDNGAEPNFAGSNAPLRGFKGDTLEAGFRVPMFFVWPGQVPADKKFDHPVTSLDFYPTFSRLAGAKIPSDKKLDGKDIWDAVKSGENPRKGEMIYAVRHRGPNSEVGIRRDQWKIETKGNSVWRLYDLNADIGEKNDLSAKYPEILKDMLTTAKKWSQGHTQPQWFDNKKAEGVWKDNNMPNYDRTFDTN